MTNLLVNKDGKYVKMENVNLSALPKTERIWLQLTNPNEIEIKRVTDELKIPEDFIRSALDDEERARIDVDDDTGYELVVFDIPVTQHHDEDSDAPYTTIPLSVIQKDNLIVTVCLNDNTKFYEIRQGNMRKNILLDSNKLLYQFLLSFHSLYELYLRAIDRSSTRLESNLIRSKKTDSDLLELMRLKNALIYFASSLRQNMIVVEKLLAKKGLDEDDVETLENILVEINQAFSTCSLQRELMTETMSTYANIVSNRLAERMRILTIVTIILAIPTLVAGMWGMNVKLPFDEMSGLWAFVVICAIIILCCLVALALTMPNKDTLSTKKKKPRRRHK